MDRRRYIGHKDFIKTFSLEIIRIDEADIKGYSSFLKIDEVHNPIIVDDFCICDSGYSMIEFLPDGENWSLEAIFDENDNIVEWYFDITKKNAVDEDGRPYNEDLYLDAVLMPDGQVLVFDEDELRSALDSNEITKKDFNMAYDTLNKLKDNGVLDVKYMTTFCIKLRLMFNNKQL